MEKYANSGIFATADLQTQDIVFADAATSLWACCYQQLGSSLDCSSMYADCVTSSIIPKPRGRRETSPYQKIYALNAPPIPTPLPPRDYR